MNGSASRGKRECPSAERNRIICVPAITGCLFLFFLLVNSPVRAGAQILSVGNASGVAGASLDIPVTLTQDSELISSLQFDITFPFSVSHISTVPGSASTAAQKSVVSNSVTEGRVRILVYNLDRNVIASGPIAIIRLKIAPGAPLADFPIMLESVFVSDTNGNTVPIIGTNGIVTSMPDTVSLIIYDVAVTQITSSSAVVTWSTNVPADSQLEYGATPSYGSSTVRNSSLTAAHSENLTGLAPGTLYHFRVISRDGSGRLMQSGDNQVQTQVDPISFPVAATFFYPRLFSANSFPLGSPDEEFVGVAIANRSGSAATLRFTAFNSNGTQVTGPNINNPLVLPLEAGHQMALIDMEDELFGSGIRGPDTMGWVKIESSVSGMAGLFMIFNDVGGTPRELDGSGITSAPIDTIVYPAIESPGFTRISIANPGTEPVTLNFSLFAWDGNEQATAERTVPPDGALIADLAAEIFPGTFLAPSSYVRVAASAPVLAYEMPGKSRKFIQVLAGQDVARGAATLYCPQYAVGTEWNTALSIINLSAVPGSVTFRMYDNSGVQIGIPRIQPIAAHGKIYLNDPAFFQSPPAEPGYFINDGYVEITSTGILITGGVVFGDPDRAVFSSALPLMSTLQTSSIFGHIASDYQYYTGLAIFNPSGNADAHVTVTLYRADGTVESTPVIKTITPRQRISQLLTQWFPALEGQNHGSGYFTVTSDIGVAGFALFGTHDRSVLSAIPHGDVR